MYLLSLIYLCTIWLRSVDLLFEVCFISLRFITFRCYTPQCQLPYPEINCPHCCVHFQYPWDVRDCARRHPPTSSSTRSHQYRSNRPPKPNVDVLDVLESFADAHVSTERYRSTLGAKKAFGRPPSSFVSSGREGKLRQSRGEGRRPKGVGKVKNL